MGNGFIVYVFPLPVCPYAKHVTLHLSNTVPTNGATVVRYTSSLLTSSGNTSSKENKCSSVYCVKSTLVLGSQTVTEEGAVFFSFSSASVTPRRSTVTTSSSSRASSLAFSGRLRTTTRMRGWSKGSVASGGVSAISSSFIPSTERPFATKGVLAGSRRTCDDGSPSRLTSSSAELPSLRETFVTFCSAETMSFTRDSRLSRRRCSSGFSGISSFSSVVRFFSEIRGSSSAGDGAK
mmetsp:Transcript_11987/g.51432  ORF Transcript_11987/g.51432 Transcript_11987/m.51432 type:complete len:236 (-) Transcript_11987:604-1311(-)